MYSNFTCLWNFTVTAPSVVTGNCSAPETTADLLVFPAFIRNVATFVIAILLVLGTCGNILVPFVVLKTKDLRNSTHLFLINLSLSDLLVLLVCMPTALTELHSKPEAWVLGEGMCRLIPFLEFAVAHVSILTILAISFERYYAICKPLKAGYTCTKFRAFLIIAGIWLIAVGVTSPMLALSEYNQVEYYDGSLVMACGTSYGTPIRKVYILSMISLLFVLPFFVLVLVYGCICQHLMIHGKALSCSSSEQAQIRARRQVVLMLVAVVMSFFVCLLPYRVFILWLISSPEGPQQRTTLEVYYTLLYVSRVMLYMNSALNPILYNAISSKFRHAFCRLLCCSGSKRGHRRRHTFNTQSTSTTNTQTFSSSIKTCSRSSVKSHPNGVCVVVSVQATNGSTNGKPV